MTLVDSEISGGLGWMPPSCKDEQAAMYKLIFKSIAITSLLMHLMMTFLSSCSLIWLSLCTSLVRMRWYLNIMLW
ncbi:unnamed protein product, partial [Nesidiocoris tenuis]